MKKPRLKLPRPPKIFHWEKVGEIQIPPANRLNFKAGTNLGPMHRTFSLFGGAIDRRGQIRRTSRIRHCTLIDPFRGVRSVAFHPSPLPPSAARPPTHAQTHNLWRKHIRAEVTICNLRSAATAHLNWVAPERLNLLG
jgi:hypothetical protein